MITVYYWRGTMQITGKAQTYRGAMRIASRNQNKFSPTFYENNQELIDDEIGLVYLKKLEETDKYIYAV